MEKCLAGWGSTHIWAGSTRLIPPTALARLQALRSTKLPFLRGRIGTAGPHWAACLCREQLSVRGQPSRVPGGELGQGPVRPFLLLRLQGSEDQLSKPSAALFVLGKQALPWVCPSVPKLS